MLFLAGQIGLDPGSMVLAKYHPDSPGASIALCNAQPIVSLASPPIACSDDELNDMDLANVMLEFRTSLRSMARVIASSTKPTVCRDTEDLGSSTNLDHSDDQDNDDDDDDDDEQATCLCIEECTVFYVSTVAQYLEHLVQGLCKWLSEKQQPQYCFCEVGCQPIEDYCMSWWGGVRWLTIVGGLMGGWRY
jgi:hypothetical protein